MDFNNKNMLLELKNIKKSYMLAEEEYVVL
jgi:hypothetical protein